MPPFKEQPEKNKLSILILQTSSIFKDVSQTLIFNVLFYI